MPDFTRAVFALLVAVVAPPSTSAVRDSFLLDATYTASQDANRSWRANAKCCCRGQNPALCLWLINARLQPGLGSRSLQCPSDLLYRDPASWGIHTTPPNCKPGSLYEGKESGKVVTVTAFWTRHGFSCANARQQELEQLELGQGWTHARFSHLRTAHWMYSDPPLTDAAILQARLFGEHIRRKIHELTGEVDPYLFSSSMTRSMETAMNNFPWWTLHPIPYIAEQGMSSDNRPLKFKEQVKRLKRSPNVKFTVVREPQEDLALASYEEVLVEQPRDRSVEQPRVRRSNSDELSYLYGGGQHQDTTDEVLRVRSSSESSLTRVGSVRRVRSSSSSGSSSTISSGGSSISSSDRVDETTAKIEFDVASDSHPHRGKLGKKDSYTGFLNFMPGALHELVDGDPPDDIPVVIVSHSHFMKEHLKECARRVGRKPRNNAVWVQKYTVVWGAWNAQLEPTGCEPMFEEALFPAPPKVLCDADVARCSDGNNKYKPTHWLERYRDHCNGLSDAARNSIVVRDGQTSSMQDPKRPDKTHIFPPLDYVRAEAWNELVAHTGLKTTTTTTEPRRRTQSWRANPKKEYLSDLLMDKMESRLKDAVQGSDPLGANPHEVVETIGWGKLSSVTGRKYQGIGGRSRSETDLQHMEKPDSYRPLLNEVREVLED